MSAMQTFVIDSSLVQDYPSVQDYDNINQAGYGILVSDPKLSHGVVLTCNSTIYTNADISSFITAVIDNHSKSHSPEPYSHVTAIGDFCPPVIIVDLSNAGYLGMSEIFFDELLKVADNKFTYKLAGITKEELPEGYANKFSYVVKNTFSDLFSTFTATT